MGYVYGDVEERDESSRKEERGRVRERGQERKKSVKETEGNI